MNRAGFCVELKNYRIRAWRCTPDFLSRCIQSLVV